MQKQRDVFLSSLCWQGVEEGVYPGAAAALVFREKNQWNKVLSACGHTCSGGAGKAVGRETFFDLASLTKPLCTACLWPAQTSWICTVLLGPCPAALLIRPTPTGRISAWLICSATVQACLLTGNTTGIFRLCRR